MNHHIDAGELQIELIKGEAQIVMASDIHQPPATPTASG
jgi:hypothetical protein